MALKEYVRLYWLDKGLDPYAKRPKVPRAMEIDILQNGSVEVADLIRRWDEAEQRSTDTRAASGCGNIAATVADRRPTYVSWMQAPHG